MRRETLLWLAPACMTLHNLEEALFMPRLLPEISVRMPAALQRLISIPMIEQFRIALVFVTVLFWLPLLVHECGGARRAVDFLLVALQAVVLLNVCSHVGSAVVLGGYAPGLATALVLNLPLSIYLLMVAIRQEWVTPHAWWAIVPLVLWMHGPGLLLLLRVAGQITQWI